MDAAAYAHWIEPLELRRGPDGELEVVCPSRLHRERVKNYYGDQVRQLLGTAPSYSVRQATDPNPVRQMVASDREQETDPKPARAAGEVEAWVLPAALVRGRPAPRRLASPDQYGFTFEGGEARQVPFWRRSANYERLTEERVAQLVAERVSRIGETYDERLAVEVAVKFPELMPRPKFALKRFPRRPARYVCRCREGRGRAARSRTIHLGMVAKVSLSEAGSRFWRVVLELQNTGKVSGRWREPDLPSAVGCRTHHGVAGVGGQADAG